MPSAPTLEPLTRPLVATAGVQPELPLWPTRPRRPARASLRRHDLGGLAPGRPEPAAFAEGLLRAVMEVLVGERPASQLLRWLAVDLYQDLAARAASRRRSGAPAAVASVHVFSPAPDVVEVTAVLTSGPRSRAAALRLEGVAGRWRCTRLTIL